MANRIGTLCMLPLVVGYVVLSTLYMGLLGIIEGARQGTIVLGEYARDLVDGS